MNTVTVRLDGQESALLSTAIDKVMVGYADGDPTPDEIVAGLAPAAAKIADGTPVAFLLTDTEQHAVRHALLAERAWAVENLNGAVDDDQTDQVDWAGIVALCDRVLLSISG